MPEFVMPVSNRRDWEKLSPFVRGFIEALFFSETACFDMAEWFEPETQHAIAEGQSDGNIPSDCDTSHIHADSLAKIVKFCEAFQTRAAESLSRAYARDYDESQAGRDLYFTHCGHGVGYWERDQLRDDGLGDALSEAAGRGEVNPFFGDHVTFGNAPFLHVELY